jgi:prepilin-type N-terminal cleavage/methylation domain-containing protein
MQKTIQNSRQGYTLIELIVVMGIIAALAALLVGGIAVAIKTSTNSQRTSNVKAIETALHARRARCGTFTGNPQGLESGCGFVTDLTQDVKGPDGNDEGTKMGDLANNLKNEGFLSSNLGIVNGGGESGDNPYWIVWVGANGFCLHANDAWCSGKDCLAAYEANADYNN